MQCLVNNNYSALKCWHLVVRKRSEVRLNSCLIIILITFSLHSTNAYKIEESISINKPIMRRGSVDPTEWVQFSTEYVRCFCNLPSCIGTAYMCKSSGGGCFSELLDQGNPNSPRGDYKGLHGCVELLNDRNQRKWCENSASTTSSKTNYRKKNQSKSLLLCCYHDMCNHADSPETKILLNDTILTGASTNDSDNRIIDAIGIKQDTALYTESEVWFRAATIAVPICGFVILLVLIILAVKLLRTESPSHSSSNPKLGIPPYSYTLSSDIKHQGAFRAHNVIDSDFFTKDSHNNPVYLNELEDIRVQGYIPLLIQDEIRNIEKNEALAKLNLIHEIEHCSLAPCDNTNVSQNLFHKNTDLHFGRNMILHENVDNNQDMNSDKTYCKESIS